MGTSWLLCVCLGGKGLPPEYLVRPRALPGTYRSHGMPGLHYRRRKTRSDVETANEPKKLMLAKRQLEI